MAANAVRPSATPSAHTKTAIQMFQDRVAQSGSQVAMRYKEGGAWRTLTFADWDRSARELCGGLRLLGVGEGDRVCLLASTRHEWVEADVAIVMAGAVTVPIYQSNTPEQCEYIISDSGAKVVIAEDPAQLAKLLDPDVRPKLGKVAKIILMSDEALLERADAQGRLRITLAEVLPQGHADRAWVQSFADARAAGRQWLEQSSGALEKTWEGITPDHTFTIVYTSGTTGPPKGVVLTHRCMVAECDAVGQRLPLTTEDEQLLFLPLAHIFAKLLEWVAIASGSRIAFAEGIAKLGENMKEVKPTFMGSVPRVYEKVFVKIQSNFAEKKKKAIAKLLVDWALSVGKRRSLELQAGRVPTGLLGLQVRLVDKLIFSKVQANFGGRMRFFISGGAPLARDIAEFFHVCGLFVLEGYGLTETTGATHLNGLDGYRFGTVGRAVEGVETVIAPDGEILVRGDNILTEYFGKPEATRESIDAQGFFHTGDIGVIEEGGFLRITDRKKDIIVTAGGKNVAPQNIESALKSRCPFASQVMVHGDKRNFLSALITLNEEIVRPWALAQGLSGTMAELAAHPKIVQILQGAVDKLNEGLASYESVKKFAILPQDLSQENGELTPTLKVKRKFCSEKYKAILDGFYA
jgi:long-chain acyl-CoA synthetase